MKKMFVITMCAAMLCAAAGDPESVCGTVSAPVLVRQTTAEDSPLVISPNSEQEGMANPFIDCTTLEEAESIAGFSMNAPKKIKGYGKQDISAIKNSLIQIIYGSGRKALYIRKSPGDSDISGDYNRYEEQKSVKIKGLQITLRGAKGRVNTAVWTNGDYSYSVFTQSAISSKRMKKIIKDVINTDIPDKASDKNAQLPSPFIDYRTMDEAAGAVGFTLKAPETVKGYKKELISVISNDTLQVMYQNGEKNLYIRKAAGDGDISGDYTKYDENKSVKIGEAQADRLFPGRNQSADGFKILDQAS